MLQQIETSINIVHLTSKLNKKYVIH